MIWLLAFIVFMAWFLGWGVFYIGGGTIHFLWILIIGLVLYALFTNSNDDTHY